MCRFLHGRHCEEGEGYEKYEIDALQEINNGEHLPVSSEEDVIEVVTFVGEDFAQFDNYKIELSYKLDDLDTEDLQSTEGIDYSWAYRYIYEKEGVNKFYVMDRVYEDGTRERELMSNLWKSGSEFIKEYNENNQNYWGSGHYVIEKEGVNNDIEFRVFDVIGENPYEPIHTSNLELSGNDYSYRTTFGAHKVGDDILWNKRIMFLKPNQGKFQF